MSASEGLLYTSASEGPLYTSASEGPLYMSAFIRGSVRQGKDEKFFFF